MFNDMRQSLGIQRTLLESSSSNISMVWTSWECQLTNQFNAHELTGCWSLEITIDWIPHSALHASCKWLLFICSETSLCKHISVITCRRHKHLKLKLQLLVTDVIIMYKIIRVANLILWKFHKKRPAINGLPFNVQ